MDGLLEQIKKLIASGSVRISSHGYDELAEDNISVREIVENAQEAVLAEEYLSYPKGPLY